MQVGTIIAERFELERLAGSGGTGIVFQAYDRVANTRVALKVLHATEPNQVQRFQREAQILAELEHPGFVRYIAHGVTEGQPYLAMEWLEGEDLDKRLGRGPLSIPDAVALVAQVAGAMALAHQRGIVHRDIKPANLWLTGGQIVGAKVLDLGLARPVARAKLALSRTGAVMGTPGYMAPEQARGSPDLDVRADVFSLGCVLYECLTGKPAFSGEHVTAILAKILFEEAPRVRVLRPDVPLELEHLVQRMLARKPAERPADAGAIAQALAEIECGAGRTVSVLPGAFSPGVLTSREQQVLCVLIAGRSGAHSGFTLTIANSELPPGQDALRDLAVQHGGRLELLVNGCAIATFTSAGQATDLVAQAARCALVLQPLLPGLAMALATGTGLVAESLPVGEAVERAARLLAQSRAGEIRLDDVSAGLLDSRFLLHRGRLVSERELPGGNRLLLGRPTACVGRDWELTTLEAAFAECVDSRSPRAVLVTAAAGVGKSRLRHEFISRLQAQDAEVWIGLGDPMRAGAPLGLLAQAVRWAFGMHGDMPLPTRHRRLRERVAGLLPKEDVARVSEFLGELASVPFPDEGSSVALRAARQDPMLMGDQMLRAFQDWLEAESATHPIIIIFEDMHWGDLPTVKFIDSALRRLVDRPVFVVALGRPEVHEKFPRLWADRGAVEINLRQLPRKACEELVRQVLGDSAKPELVKRIVERADGNAFYLEELIRTVAEGGEDLPPSVIAMLQLRIAALPESLRLVLRAASVFGGVFYEGALAALLGIPEPSVLQRRLSELVEREWVARARGSRFADEAAYTFRHDLVREAAYATFTEADRVLGHRLAADWLERVGETEAIVIAEHCKRGGDHARAVRWFRRAAEQAMESNDLVAAIVRAERAAECGATDSTLGALRVLQAEAHNWRGEWNDGDCRGSQAVELLPAGTPLWAHAIHQSFWARMAQGKADEIDGLVALLLEQESNELISRLHAIAHANIASHLMFLNRKHEAMTVIEALAHSAHLSEDPIAAGSIAQVFARRELMMGKPASALDFYTHALKHFDAAGDVRQVCMTRNNQGWLLGQLGEYCEAERVLHMNATFAKSLNLPALWATSLIERGIPVAHLGRHREAIAVVREGIDVLSSQDNPAGLSLARIYMSRLEHLAGDFEVAEREAEQALEQAASIPTLRTKALAVLAQALMAAGKFADAALAAQDAVAILENIAGIDDWDAFVRLVHAQTLLGTGQTGAARAAIELGYQRLQSRAALIESQPLRQSFLYSVPENAMTLELAERELAKPRREAEAGSAL